MRTLGFPIIIIVIGPCCLRADEYAHLAHAHGGFVMIMFIVLWCHRVDGYAHLAHVHVGFLTIIFLVPCCSCVDAYADLVFYEHLRRPLLSPCGRIRAPRSRAPRFFIYFLSRPVLSPHRRFRTPCSRTCWFILSSFSARVALASTLKRTSLMHTARQTAVGFVGVSFGAIRLGSALLRRALRMHAVTLPLDGR